MGDIAFVMVRLLGYIVKGAVIFAVIFGVVFIVNLAFSMIFVTLNQGALGDIFAMIQLWLPFNLNVILLWLTTASIAYVGYRLSLFVYNLVDSYVST